MRGVGLWAGVDIDPRLGDGRAVSEALAARGVLVKDTHGATIRISPPLVVTRGGARLAVDALGGRRSRAERRGRSAATVDGFGVPNLAHSDDRSALGDRQFGPYP